MKLTMRRPLSTRRSRVAIRSADCVPVGPSLGRPCPARAGWPLRPFAPNPMKPSGSSGRVRGVSGGGRSPRTASRGTLLGERERPAAAAVPAVEPRHRVAAPSAVRVESPFALAVQAHDPAGCPHADLELRPGVVKQQYCGAVRLRLLEAGLQA